MENGPVFPRQNTGGVFEDFDILVPPLREAKIGGLIFDVSAINTKIAFEALRVANSDVENFTDDKFDKLIDIAVEICQLSNPAIDKTWILANTKPMPLMKFITFAVQSINSEVQEAGIETGTGGEAGKN